MDAMNPYEQLGVKEDASFEEVRDMRDQLLREAGTDQVQLERIEAAYDAILRDRLRARIEGKIKVPDRIRFAEKSVSEVIGERNADAPADSSSWIVRTLDNPDKNEVLRNFAIFSGLGLVSYLGNSTQAIVSTMLSIGLIASFYLLYQKEHRFGRALLFTALALTLGSLLGYLGNLAFPNSGNLTLMSSLLFSLWVITTFLR